MIYGLNFGGPDIPETMKLSPRIIRHDSEKRRSYKLALVGVCNTKKEKNEMSITADNGHRKLYWMEMRLKDKSIIHVLYVG